MTPERIRLDLSDARRAHHRRTADREDHLKYCQRMGAQPAKATMRGLDDAVTRAAAEVDRLEALLESVCPKSPVDAALGTLSDAVKSLGIAWSAVELALRDLPPLDARLAMAFRTELVDAAPTLARALDVQRPQKTNRLSLKEVPIIACRKVAP